MIISSNSPRLMLVFETWFPKQKYELYLICLNRLIILSESYPWFAYFNGHFHQSVATNQIHYILWLWKTASHIEHLRFGIAGTFLSTVCFRAESRSSFKTVYIINIWTGMVICVINLAENYRLALKLAITPGQHYGNFKWNVILG